MKNLTAIILISIFLISCGQDEEEKSLTNSNYKYSYCGTVTGSQQQLQLVTTSGNYNLTFNNNQSLMNQMYQYANNNQQTCVQSNHQPQTNNSGNTGYTGYSLPSIIVQYVGNTTTSGLSGNYSVSLCGMIYASYMYGGSANQSPASFNIQITNGESNEGIAHYQIQAANANVTSMLAQLTNGDKTGCIYSNQQPVQSGYSLTIQAEQVVFQ